MGKQKHPAPLPPADRDRRAETPRPPRGRQSEPQAPDGISGDWP